MRCEQSTIYIYMPFDYMRCAVLWFLLVDAEWRINNTNMILAFGILFFFRMGFGFCFVVVQARGIELHDVSSEASDGVYANIIRRNLFFVVSGSFLVVFP